MSNIVEDVFLETVAKVVVNGDIEYVLENKEEDRFLEAIGADSLDRVQIVMALEDTFDINITDEEVEDFVKMSCDEILHMLESAGASAESMRRARAQKESQKPVTDKNQAQETPEPVVDKEQTQESTEPVVDKEQTQETPEPVADKEQTQESTEPVVDKEQTQETPEPVADKEQTQESTDPVVDKEQTQETPEPVADKEQTQESQKPIADKEQTQESPEPVVDKEQTQETPEPVADKEQTQETPEPVADKEQTQESQKPVADKEQTQESPEPVVDKEQTQKIEFKTILHQAENLVASIKLFETAQNNITAPSKQQPKPAIELRTMKDGKPYCELLGKKCNRPERPNNTGKVYCEFMNCRIYNNFQRLR